jgi:hypothetical protein
VKLSIFAYKEVQTISKNVYDFFLTVPVSIWSASDLVPGNYYINKNPNNLLISDRQNALPVDDFNIFLKSLIHLVSGEYPSTELIKVQGMFLRKQSYPFHNLTQFNFCPSEIKDNMAIAGFGASSSQTIRQDFLSFSSLAENYKNADLPNFYTIYNFLRSAFDLASQNGIILFCVS